MLSITRIYDALNPAFAINQDICLRANSISTIAYIMGNMGSRWKIAFSR